MKKLTLLIILSITLILTSAQEMKYSRVRIYTGQQGIATLLSAGIPVDDAEIRPGAYITCELSQADIEKVTSTGLRHEVLIEDVSTFYENRSIGEMHLLEELRNSDNLLNLEWEVPEGFSLGSIGGFCSIDEMLDHLDTMLANYPDLISPVYQFDSLTHEGRPIYWVRISDNPSQDEDEPEVLLTGMHHAREPIGMQHLLFFMYYLLENYDTDPQIHAILDNTELYIVPIINMDGYARNILTNQNGGGMWRKNRRDNGDGTYGVDPNRNYAFAWGWDNSGSSPDPGDATYRGPYAFSEPCTQVMRDFCESQEFKIALNYHSYSNLLLYPWGYIPDLPPDDAIFSAFAEIMTMENGYTFGPGYTTIYMTNGASDDWMYGEQQTKDKIFSYTPEIGGGSDGFWPAPSRIIPLCQENMWQSMMAVKLAGPYAEVKDISPSIIENMDGHFSFNIERLGLGEDGEYTVYIAPVNDAITSVSDPVVFDDLDVLETVSDSIAYTLRADIQNGEEIIYVLAVDNGLYTTTEVINKIYGSPVVVFADNAENFNNWISNKWNTTPEDFHSPDSSISDSPFSDYNNYEVSMMMLEEPIDLTNAIYATLGFWAKWEIEAGYDFVQVEASSNGQTWTPLTGNYTEPGTSNQAPDEPVYDGFQTTWVKEEMNLGEFIGEEIYVRFILKADSYVVEDGFYWDDLKVTIVDIATGINDPGYAEELIVTGPVPNPARDRVRFELGHNQDVYGVTLMIYNSTGQQIYEKKVDNHGEIVLPVSGWNDGIYFYRFSGQGKAVKSGKLIVY